ncbi:SDR family NAD(P)-dependent oxidoreductase [Sporosarcina sp. FSL K6-3457]|uniref:SDR family NAD(P)-dependent oxidoreductase n=1 Tax=Sporosarcina sp. FSL K6-3457 TaxID=2978204 RepID=UPI0030FC918B
MDIMLNGKTALVIGGSSPMISAICTQLAESGVHVWHQLFKQEKQEKVPLVTSIVADVRNPNDMKKLITTILNESEKIDLLINASPMEPACLLSELAVEDWLRVFEFHIDVPFLSCREIIPQMVRQGGGAVVNISSSAAITGEGGPHFAAAKSTLNAMTRGLAREYRGQGIQVNGVAPSPFTKDEEENRSIAASTAAMVVLLCSEYGRRFSGETIMIDGGESVG